MNEQQIEKAPKNELVTSLLSESFKNQIKLALPKHLTPDRFIRIALTELRKIPDLMQCDKKSFLGAIVQTSQLGLEPGDNLGRAYLIPFNNRKKGTKECQLIIGYRGMLDLVRRSGQIDSISAHCVYENDTFEFEYGLEEKLKHIPTRGDQGALVAAYAIAKFKNGGYQFEVMFKKDIDKIRTTSKAGGSTYSPWATDYPEMGKKTVLRRLCKYLPMSIEVQQAITVDELGDIGKQNFTNNITDTLEIIKSDYGKENSNNKMENSVNKISALIDEKNASDNETTKSKANVDKLKEAFDAAEANEV